MLTIPSLIAKVETRADKGLKVVIHTNELESSVKKELMDQHQQFGYFIFSPTDNISESDIPNEPVEFNNQKTYSERLRNVLFRLHEKRGGKAEDFESYPL